VTREYLRHELEDLRERLTEMQSTELARIPARAGDGAE
jgi:hypothetical protein